MLTYVLAWTVALGSLGMYLAAFLFPEVHRKNDFIWSGIGLFYALILWVYAPRMTGGLLLGQTASVALLVWLGWQTLSLRRDLVPPEQRTPLPGSLGHRLETLVNQTKGFLGKVGLPGFAAPATPTTQLTAAAQPIAQPPVVVRPEPVPSPEPAPEAIAEETSASTAPPASESAVVTPKAPTPSDLGSRLRQLPIPVDLPKFQEQVTGWIDNAKAKLPNLQEQITGWVGKLRGQTQAPPPAAPSAGPPSLKVTQESPTRTVIEPATATTPEPEAQPPEPPATTPESAVQSPEPATTPEPEAQPPEPPSAELVETAQETPEPAPAIDLETEAPDATLAPPAEGPRSPEVQAWVETHPSPPVETEPAIAPEPPIDDDTMTDWPPPAPSEAAVEEEVRGSEAEPPVQEANPDWPPEALDDPTVNNVSEPH